MRKIHWKQVLTIVWVVSLILVYLILWTKMINNPSERSGTDFIAFYTAGRIAREHGTSQVYNISLQKKIQTQIVGFELADEQVLLYNHMPVLIPILFVISSQDYVDSFALWTLFSIGIYLAATIQFAKIHPESWSQREKWFFSIAMFTFFPFFISLLLGQDSAILILGMTLFCIGLIKGNEYLTGLGLVMTLVVRPHLSLSFAIPVFFFQRKTFFVFAASAIVLALLSFFLLGRSGVIDFLNILYISANGKWYGMNESAMFNIIGFLKRALPFWDGQIVRILGWIIYFANLALFSFLWFRRKEITPPLLSVTILAAILAAPHFHYHDLGLMLFPIFFSITSMKIHQPALVLGGISILLLFGKAITALEYILPYMIMLILLICLILLQISPSSILKTRN